MTPLSTMPRLGEYGPICSNWLALLKTRYLTCGLYKKVVPWDVVWIHLGHSACCKKGQGKNRTTFLCRSGQEDMFYFCCSPDSFFLEATWSYGQRKVVQDYIRSNLRDEAQSFYRFFKCNWLHLMFTPSPSLLNCISVFLPKFTL